MFIIVSTVVYWLPLPLFSQTIILKGRVGDPKGNALHEGLGEIARHSERGSGRVNHRPGWPLPIAGSRRWTVCRQG